MIKTLKEYRKRIKKEVPYVGIKPYSHNIIGLVLMEISNSYGVEEANKCIAELGLKALGWRKIKKDWKT